jgi:hypothetical protein
MYAYALCKLYELEMFPFRREVWDHNNLEKVISSQTFEDERNATNRSKEDKR